MVSCVIRTNWHKYRSLSTANISLHKSTADILLHKCAPVKIRSPTILALYFIQRQSHIFFIFCKRSFLLILKIWQLLSFLDTVTILVTDFTNPDNLTKDLLIFNSLIDSDTLPLRRALKQIIVIVFMHQAGRHCHQCSRQDLYACLFVLEQSEMSDRGYHALQV